jgi:hypothetical protein
MGEKSNSYSVLLGNQEEKRPLRRPKSGGEDNIKMDLRGIGWVVWTGLIWLRARTSGGGLF